MRLPRPRISLRWLMVAVAIVAAILGLQEERRSRFKRISHDHDKAWKELDVSDLELYLLLTSRPNESTESEAARLRAARPLKDLLCYHGLMTSKYEMASRKPLFPVPSDPTPPPQLEKEYVKSLIDRYVYAWTPGEPEPPEPK